MSKTEFYRETERKDQLLSLLENLEAEVRFKPHERTLKYGFYDRIFNGVAEVEKIGKTTLRLKRESGRPLGMLLVNPYIVRLAKKGDHLMATLGQRNGQWYLIQIQMIGNYVSDGNGQSQMHLSVRTGLSTEPDGPYEVV